MSDRRVGQLARRRLFTSAISISLLAIPVSADLVLVRSRIEQTLDQQGEVVSSQERSDTIFIGNQVARWDLGSSTFVVRLDDGIYLYVDHEARAYAEMPLPLILESLLTDGEKECLSKIPQELMDDVEASVSLTGEQRVVGQWHSSRLRVIGRHPKGLEFEEDWWITHDLPIELEPYLQLIQNKGALSTSSRGWIGKAAAANGFPVELVVTRRYRGRADRLEQRLDSVTEVAADRSRYLAPAGYSASLQRPPLDFRCFDRSKP